MYSLAFLPFTDRTNAAYDKTPVMSYSPFSAGHQYSLVLNRMLTLLFRDRRDRFNFKCNVILIFTILLLWAQADMSVK